MTFKKISALKPGDLVDVVSPGSGSRFEDVQLCVELLESWGLKVRLPKETFSEHPFHSNEDAVRLKLLKKALMAKDSKAIWCLRGGYGSNRLLPEMWKWKAPAQAKMLIGYSDITSLHLFLNQKWKWPSFHGPLLESLISGRLSLQQQQEAREVLFGEKRDMKFSLKPLNSRAKKIKSLKASLSGGNLVVIESALGTPYNGNFQGKILFLEEVGERGYRIDRMLEHLRQSGSLKACKALVFGDFLYGDERDGKNFVSYAIERFAQLNLLPCFSGLATGHGEQNRMIPLGPKAILSSEELLVPTGLFQESQKGKRR
ncbi:MAG: LD-carboxypeptidase [Pseudobdellovibrionaceae bacterium]